MKLFTFAEYAELRALLKTWNETNAGMRNLGADIHWAHLPNTKTKLFAFTEYAE
jgi:hypothetical protein